MDLSFFASAVDDEETLQQENELTTNFKYKNSYSRNDNAANLPPNKRQKTARRRSPRYRSRKVNDKFYSEKGNRNTEFGMKDTEDNQEMIEVTSDDDYDSDYAIPQDIMNETSREFDPESEPYKPLFELLSTISQIPFSIQESWNARFQFLKSVFDFILSNTVNEDSFSLRVILSLLPTKFYKNHSSSLSVYVDYPFTPSMHAKSSVSHHARFKAFQKLIFEKFDDRDLSLENVGSVDSSEYLSDYFEKHFDQEQLEELCYEIQVNTEFIPNPHEWRKKLLIACLVQSLKRSRCLSEITQSWIYPVHEKSIFQDFTRADSDSILKMGKCASPQDFIYRLYFHHAQKSYAKLQKVFIKALSEIKPKFDNKMLEGSTRTGFAGKSLNALPLENIVLHSIGDPKVSDLTPRHVYLDITYSLSNEKPDVKLAWDRLKLYDTIYIAAINMSSTEEDRKDGSFMLRKMNELYGLKCLRSATIVGVLDEFGNELKYFYRGASVYHCTRKSVKRMHPSKRYTLQNIYDGKRILRIALDTRQFIQDVLSRPGQNIKQQISTMTNFYEGFNVIIRAPHRLQPIVPGLNALESDILSIEKMPVSWIQKTLVGISSKPKLSGPILIGMGDTFVDVDHVKETLSIQNLNTEDESNRKIENYDVSLMIEIKKLKKKSGKDVGDKDNLPMIEAQLKGSKAIGIIIPPLISNRNTVRYTAEQIEAIKSALSPGLTLIDGPMKSGKKLLVNQIISNVLLDKQKILIVAPNKNQLVDILTAAASKHPYLDHTLTLLGDNHFNPFDRLKLLRHKKYSYLNIVDELAKSIDVQGAYSKSCETAVYFYKTFVKPRLQTFDSDAHHSLDQFPFKKFCVEYLKEFSFENISVLVESIHEMFNFLEKISALELVRKPSERTLIYTKTISQVIAVSASEMLLHREVLSSIVGLETVLLFKSEDLDQLSSYFGFSLYPKSVILFSETLKQTRNLSLISRLLSCDNFQPQQLTQLFDIRQEISDCLSGLTSQKINFKGKLTNNDDMAFENPGFLHPVQFVNIPSYEGDDERQCRAEVDYRNLGEAEFIVAVFMFMRLIGYEAEQIRIATPFPSQKKLIEDILKYKCVKNPIFGSVNVSLLADVSILATSKYLLVSLVRTSVATNPNIDMFRASRGVYLFGRWKPNENSFNFLTDNAGPFILFPDESVAMYEKGEGRKRGIIMQENREKDDQEEPSTPKRRRRASPARRSPRLTSSPSRKNKSPKGKRDESPPRSGGRKIETVEEMIALVKELNSEILNMMQM